MGKKVTLDSSVLAGLVGFMQGADSLIGKQASLETAIAAEAPGIVDALINANLISEGVKQASVQRLSSDPTFMVELLKKAADAMKPESPIGTSVAVKSASEELSADEAFIRELRK
jgi:hypothetical protein